MRESVLSHASKIIFRTTCTDLVHFFFSKLFFFGSKSHKNFQNFHCCSTFCEQHVSAMPISAISGDSLSYWQSNLFNCSASYSVVEFLFGENTSIHDSQNPSSAAVFWYAIQSWKLFTLKTNLHFHTQISLGSIARILSTSLLSAAFLFVKDDTDEVTSICCLLRHLRC